MEEKLVNSYNETDDTIQVSLNNNVIITFENLDKVLSNKNIVAEQSYINESMNNYKVSDKVANKIKLFFINVFDYVNVKVNEKIVKEVENFDKDTLTQQDESNQLLYDSIISNNEKTKNKFEKALEKAIIEIESGDGKDLFPHEIKNMQFYYNENDFLELLSHHKDDKLDLKDFEKLSNHNKKTLTKEIKYTLVNNPDYYAKIRNNYLKDLAVDIEQNKLNVMNVVEEVNNILEEIRNKKDLNAMVSLEEPAIYNLNSNEVTLDRTIKQIEDIAKEYTPENSSDIEPKDIKDISIKNVDIIEDFNKELELFKQSKMETIKDSEAEETIQVPVEEIQKRAQEEIETEAKTEVEAEIEEKTKSSEDFLARFERLNFDFENFNNSSKFEVPEAIQQFYSDLAAINMNEGTNLDYTDTNNNIKK